MISYPGTPQDPEAWKGEQPEGQNVHMFPCPACHTPLKQSMDDLGELTDRYRAAGLVEAFKARLGTKPIPAEEVEGIAMSAKLWLSERHAREFLKQNQTNHVEGIEAA